MQVVTLAGRDQREVLRLAGAVALLSVAFTSGFSALTALVSELNYEKIGARGRVNAMAYALTHHLI